MNMFTLSQGEDTKVKQVQKFKCVVSIFTEIGSIDKEI